MRTSKLGILYDLKTGVDRVKELADELELSFEFYIKCGERLPIETKILNTFHNNEAAAVQDVLKARGLTIVYNKDESSAKLVELT